MEKHPVLLVAALVLDDADCILLTRHAPYHKWHLPDGEVRFGERLLDALARSFQEDFAVMPLFLDAKPWDVHETLHAQRGVHYVTQYFRVVVQKATLLRPREGLEMRWLDLQRGYSVSGLLQSTVKAIDEASWKGLL